MLKRAIKVIEGLEKKKTIEGGELKDLHLFALLKKEVER